MRAQHDKPGSPASRFGLGCYLWLPVIERRGLCKLRQSSNPDLVKSRFSVWRIIYALWVRYDLISMFSGFKKVCNY